MLEGPIITAQRLFLMKAFFSKAIAATFVAIHQQKLNLKRFVGASLLGLMLWGIAAPAYAVPYENNDDGRIQNTERYDQIQAEKDGMNTFEAVDPRRDTAAVEAKAQTLKDTAERRKTQANDPLETAREAIKDLVD